jgi:hypothetical protein
VKQRRRNVVREFQWRVFLANPDDEFGHFGASSQPPAKIAGWNHRPGRAEIAGFCGRTADQRLLNNHLNAKVKPRHVFPEKSARGNKSKMGLKEVNRDLIHRTELFEDAQRIRDSLKIVL